MYCQNQVEKAKQDDAFSDLSNILGDLKNMAVDIGGELDRSVVSLLPRGNYTFSIYIYSHYILKHLKVENRKLYSKSGLITFSFCFDNLHLEMTFFACFEWIIRCSCLEGKPFMLNTAVFNTFGIINRFHCGFFFTQSHVIPDSLAV